MDHAASIDAYVAACQPVEGQVGAVFAVNGAIVGFDLFDEPSTFRTLLSKLVRSVAVEAIDSAAAAQPFAVRRVDRRGTAGHAAQGFSSAPRASSTLSRTLAEQFLAVTSGAPQHTAKAVGLGDDVRLTAPGMTGAALVVDRHVVHVAAFAL